MFILILLPVVPVPYCLQQCSCHLKVLVLGGEVEGRPLILLPVVPVCPRLQQELNHLQVAVVCGEVEWQPLILMPGVSYSSQLGSLYCSMGRAVICITPLFHSFKSTGHCSGTCWATLPLPSLCSCLCSISGKLTGYNSISLKSQLQFC